MDSLTHIVTGGIIGAAYLGKKAGFKAAAFGAVAACIPDIDVPIGLFLSDLGQISFHRGITHSILFALFAAPLSGWLMHKFQFAKNVSMYAWSILALLCLASHLTLDLFTTYGIQLFYPFNSSFYSWSVISIIDIFFTIPLIAGLLIWSFFKYFKKRHHATVIYISLIFGFFYLSYCGVNKYMANTVFKAQMKKDGIEAERHFTKPMLFSNFLWRVLIETEDKYYIGFYSVFDESREIYWIKEDANHHKIADIKNSKAIQTLKNFSSGYYNIVEDEEGRLSFNNLQFGRAAEWEERETAYVYSFYIEKNDEVKISKKALSFSERKDRPDPSELINRTFGRK